MSQRKKYTRRNVLFATGLAAAGAGVFATVHKFRRGILSALGSGSSLGKEFRYDMSGLTKIDPTLIAFDCISKFQLDMVKPRGLAVDAEDHIYVGGPDAVSVFSQQGRKLSHVALKGRPTCLAVGADGRLYVGMVEHVEVYSTVGKLAARWPGLGDGSLITSIAISAENVAVADYCKGVVLCFDSAGRKIRVLGAKDGDFAFEVPSPYFDIAFAPDGMLRVVNPGKLRIEAWMLDGNREFHWGADGEGVAGFVGCCNPVHLAVLPDGRIVTSEKGIQRLKIFKADRGFGQNGQLDCVVANPNDFAMGTPLEVAGDSAGRVIVLEPDAKIVHVFAPKEKVAGV